MMGRPSKMTPKVTAEICRRLAEGESLRKVCKSEEMPDKTTVLRWLRENAEFRTQYVHAREDQADHFVDECIDIADDGKNDTYVDDEGNTKTDYDVIARSRLRVDARKWAAGKLNPKKYGDKITQEVINHPPPITDADLIA